MNHNLKKYIFQSINTISIHDHLSDLENTLPIKGDPPFYKYCRQSSLALGRNFDPKDITQAKPACIIYTSEPLDAGSPGATIEATFVRNWRQLNSTIGLDIHFEARYLAAGGSLDYTFNSETDFTESSISVVIRASADYGRYAVKAGAQLTPEAFALRDNSAEFAKRYGTRYVAIERRGAHLAVMLTIRSLDESTKSTFTSEFKADGGWGKLSAKASVKFNDMLKIAAKQSRLQISATSTGGEGLSQLSKLLLGSTNSEDPLADMKSHISQTLDGFSKTNASPVEYTVSSMKDFFWDPDGVPSWDDPHEEGIQQLAADYRNALRDVEIIENYVKKRGDYYALFPDFFAYRGAIEQIKERVESYIGAVKDRHKACLSGFSFEACSLPEGRYANDNFGRKFFNEILQERARIPAATIEVYAVKPDGTLSFLDTVKSASVFKFSPGKRLSLVKQFEPDASWFYAMISIRGVSLIGFKQITEYSDGTTQIIDHVVEGEFSFGLAEEGRDDSEVGFETDTINWMAKHRGEWSATTSFILIDKTNREFPVRLLEAIWQANGSSITHGELRIMASNGVLERNF